MSEICVNCKNPVNQNFCESCGQKKYKRIDKKYIWDELQYTVVHTNKGLFYSLKKLLRNPGKTAREYIDGNRVNHYKPISLVFVLSGISAFVSFKMLNYKDMMQNIPNQSGMNTKFIADYTSFFQNNFSFIMLALIPLFALTTKIAFRKWGNNYYEHIVMNSYILSYYTLFTLILVTPVMFFFRHSPSTVMSISFYSMFLIPLILTWFFKEYYHDKPLDAVILKVLGVAGLTILGFILLFIFAILIGYFFGRYIY